MQGDASSLVMNATIMKANFARRSKGLQFRHDLVWYSPGSQTVWTPTSSHFVSRFTNTEDFPSRFNTEDELPTGGLANGNPPPVDTPFHPSEDVARTGDLPRQTLQSPGLADHVSHDRGADLVTRQSRKRTPEHSPEGSGRSRNAPEQPGTSGAAEGSNTSIIARRLQELEDEVTKISRRNLVQDASSHPAQVPSRDSPVRSITLGRSPSPGTSSRPRDGIAGSALQALLRGCM